MSAWLDAGWPAPAGVRAVTTLRHGAGVSEPPFDHFNLGLRCGDEPTAVAANRDQLLARLSLPSGPCWLRQVHGTTVLRFHGSPAPAPGPHGAGASARERRPAAESGTAIAAEPEADAAVTADPGVVLAILTADCLPLLLAADDGSELGAAHAGWRGLAGGVIEATVAAMRTPPARLLAWLGPAAGPQAYEVGGEVRAAFVDADPGAAAAFVPTRPGHWLCDLYALARRRLAALGVARSFGGGRCTISEPEAFFSHRRDRRTGRMATLLWRP